MVLVNGYDIDPQNPALWEATHRRTRAIADADQVTLVDIETNVRSLTDPILPWPYAVSGGLAAVALLLRAGIKQVYIPASYDVDHQAPWFNFDTDRLWSTEVLNISHDGFESSRLNKVQYICQWPLALQHLRVCYANKKDTYNCGECEKCLRTMVSIYAAGMLDKAETFPQYIDAARLSRVPIDSDIDAFYHQENLAALQARQLAPHLQAAIEAALARAGGDSGTPLIRRFMNKVDHLDFSYARGSTRRLKARITGRNF